MDLAGAATRSSRRSATPLRGRTRIRRGLVAVFVVAVGVLGSAVAASAHAELESSSPVDGAVLATAPEVITITYSEGVTAQPGGVRVVDSRGDRVDTGATTATGSVVRAPLRGGLPNGSYLVAWRVVSADSHPVRGAFTFSVGRSSQLDDGLAQKAFGSGGDRADEIAGAVLRAIAYVGALGAAGLVGMGLALRRPDEGPIVSRLAAGGAIAAVVAIIAQLPLQAALATGEGLGSITQAGVLGIVLGEGVWWSLALTGLGLVAMALCVGLVSNRVTRTICAIGAVAAPLGFAITGHSRTMSPAVVAYAADTAHLLAGAAWFGGLIALVLTVRNRRRAGDDLGAAEAVATFSGWAAVILAAVVVTGTTMGWIEVGGLHGLTSTTYGQLLIAKVLLVGAIAAVAAWNRFSLLPIVARAVLDEPTRTDPTNGPDAADESPEVEAAPGDGVEPESAIDAATTAGADPLLVPGPAPSAPWATLVRAMRVEVIGIVLVLVLTAVLVNVVPAKTAAGNDLLSLRAKLGDGTVELVVDPTGGGRIDFHAYLLDKLGRPDARYKEATFAFSLPAEDIGPLTRKPIRPSPGHFQVLGLRLAPAGTWSLTVTVKVDKFDEEEATLSFPVR